MFSKKSRDEWEARVKFCLQRVGLDHAAKLYPSEISGGMAKRAGLARAIALDPLVLFFDEPSAGLDPISSHRLDELIMQMRDCLGATIIVVSHELASIFDIADRAIFLDAKTKRQTAIGNPHELLRSGSDEVKLFLSRGVQRKETL
jgi:phospholipid/cholesterol/gamma-HCH transport system ATP-binding protein